MISIKKLLKTSLKRAGFRLERIKPLPNSPIDLENASNITESDVEYHFGDWRYRVSSTIMVGRPCFGYGLNSWHPFVETIRQLLENPNLAYEESALC
ncbi:MAG: hypothetical protein AAF483_11820, partial [Planctomycetota bacterium]